MSHEPLPIFISYASYDNKNDNPEERWLDRLLQFLRPLNLDESISTWTDTELKVGANWRSEIKSAIEKAKVSILLVSPAFLASDFIRSEELPRLLRKASPTNEPGEEGEDTSEGMLIIPILLRPCLIHYAKFEIFDDTSEVSFAKLSDFQYVPKGSAMNGLSQYDQDRQFESIANRIIDALEIREIEKTQVISDKETHLVKETLLLFLKQYSKWWFNALRIKSWGGKQENYKTFGGFTVHQLTSLLNELADSKQIRRKQGKKSLVFMTNKD